MYASPARPSVSAGAHSTPFLYLRRVLKVRGRPSRPRSCAKCKLCAELLPPVPPVATNGPRADGVADVVPVYGAQRCVRLVSTPWAVLLFAHFCCTASPHCSYRHTTYHKRAWLSLTPASLELLTHNLPPRSCPRQRRRTSGQGTTQRSLCSLAFWSLSPRLHSALRASCSHVAICGCRPAGADNALPCQVLSLCCA